MNKQTRRRAERGGTLIEVAIGVLVLAVLALGASMLYHQSWGQISVQRNKRAALVVANSRLEALRASGYSAIEPPDGAQYYVAASGTDWVLSGSDPNKTISVNGRDLPIKTTVLYVNADPTGVDDYASLQVRVAVAYREATRDDDFVVLETLVSP